MKKAIVLNDYTIKILSNILDYEADRLKEAEKRDAFKDNGYLINACDEFKQASEKAEAVKEAKQSKKQHDHDEKLINALYNAIMTDANTTDKQKSSINGVVFFYQCGRLNALQVVARFMLIINGVNAFNEFNNKLTLNVLADE